MRKFCVAVDDQGRIMVGEETEGAEAEGGAGGSIESLVGTEDGGGMPGEGAEDEGYLQPVEGLEAALAAVREFVASAAGGENQEMVAEREAETAFKAGYGGRA